MLKVEFAAIRQRFKFTIIFFLISNSINSQANYSIEMIEKINGLIFPTFYFYGESLIIKEDSLLPEVVKSRPRPFMYIDGRKKNYEFYRNNYSLIKLNRSSTLFKNYKLSFDSSYWQSPEFVDNAKVVGLFNSISDNITISIHNSGFSSYVNRVSDSYTISADTAEISFNSDTARSLGISSRNASFYFGDCSFKKLVLSGVLKDLKIHNCVIPDTLVLSGIISDNLDLRSFTKSANSCQLLLDNVDVSKIILNYVDYHFLPVKDGINNESRIISNYTQLLQSQKTYGYEEGYRKLDTEFKEYKYLKLGGVGYLLNNLDKHWWGYSYKKHLIFRNSFVLLFSVFLINLLCFERLVSQTYIIEEVGTANKRIKKKYYDRSIRRRVRQATYCFIYTCFIFWGWKLSFDKLKLQNLTLALWIIFQYLLGITCLAYLANYIISK